MSTRRSAADSYDAGNLRAARIIAADPERYAGLMVTWARLVLNRQDGAEGNARQPGLFDSAGEEGTVRKLSPNG